MRRIRRRRQAAGSAVVLLFAAAVGIFVLATGNDNDVEGASETPAALAGGPSPGGAARPAGARPGPGWRAHTGPVPILMYHVIGDPAAGASYPGLYVPEAEFRQQVAWAAENGYTAVTLDQVQRAWYDGATLPPKPIVFSFDDGYLGQYLYALPILAEHGWAGQLNLKAEGSDLVPWQVRKMIDAGWELAAHTITHPDLTGLSGPDLAREVGESRRILQRRFGVPVHNFCYPAGRYDEEVERAVEAAGYRGATTVDPGLAERSEPFTLKRIRVSGGDGASGVAATLTAAGA